MSCKNHLRLNAEESIGYFGGGVVGHAKVSVYQGEQSGSNPDRQTCPMMRIEVGITVRP